MSWRRELLNQLRRVRRPAPAAAPGPRLDQHVLVACARWEAGCISEWLSYHREIGFDKVYLYCNDDDPSELYAAVLPFTVGPKPFVEFLHFGLQGQQRRMYMHFLEHFADRCEWFMFLDIDEFLLLRDSPTIGAFRGAFPAAVDALYFNWIFAGNNGYVTRPEGPVLPRYTRRADHVHPFTKVLTRSAALDDPGLRKARLEPFWHDMLSLLKPDATGLNVLGEDMRGYYVDFPEAASRRVSEPAYLSGVVARAFVYHVAFKSEDDLRRRHQRGTGGDFYSQTMWKDLHDRGPDDIRGFMAMLNAVEETHLATFWARMMARASTIVSAPPGRNLAAGRPALQSSIGPWSRQADPAADAVGAVDGRPDGTFHQHTEDEADPWWWVDLGEVVPITQVRLFNRLDDARDRFRDFTLSVSDDGRAWTIVLRKADGQPFGGVDGRPFIWAAPAGLSGRFVRISVEGRAIIDLDQVEVY